MIQCKGLEKAYGTTTALKGLSLEVKPGEIYGLLGPNGAGKSTTISILLGLNKPDGGSASISGVDVKEGPAAIGAKVGYVSEHVSLYPFLSGYENLSHFTALRGKPAPREELEALLKTLGLEESALHRRAETYSKGMAQKVGLAVALAGGATTLVLDEPASGLDPQAASMLGSALRSLADQGVAILMTTHDLFQVRRVCHRVGILSGGRLQLECKPDTLDIDELEKLYLGVLAAQGQEPA